MRTGLIRVLIGAALVGQGCGGHAEPPETVERSENSGSERVEGDDGVEVSGLLGTIRQDQVRGTLEPRMRDFAGCLEARTHTFEALGGEIRLSFRIRTDGSVAWVYPSASTIGDREAERCILEVASRARFPRPHGGEAEFSWGFGIDPPADVRPPLEWDAAQVVPVLARGAPDLASRCRVHGVRVTAYIAPGGRVIAAGASTPDPDSLERVDCVLDAVRRLAMPDPGSYAAKVTFTVQ
jgi:hypothetical protein